MRGQLILDLLESRRELQFGGFLRMIFIGLVDTARQFFGLAHG